MADSRELVSEGEVEISVPSVKGEVDTDMEVFYNPEMESNRDISVSFIDSVYSEGDRFLDSHGGTGIRGLRMASSIDDLDVCINDWSRDAAQLIKKNADRNSISVEIKSLDANVLMSERYFDIIDLDPFGSPVPYLDSAARSVGRGGFVSMTATDTAPLSGAHKKAGLRRYSALPLNTPYHKELGARLLVGKTVMVFAQHDLSTTSLLTYYKDHYFRSYVKVDKGAKKANKTIEKMGYLVHCFNCGYRDTELGLNNKKELPDRCNCGETLSLCGPIYLGSLYKDNLLEKTIENLEKSNFGSKKQSLKLLRTCLEESGYPPTYYDIHKQCKIESLRAPKTESVLNSLKEKDFKATKTHFNPLGIKTDADVKEIKQVLHELN